LVLPLLMSSKGLYCKYSFFLTLLSSLKGYHKKAISEEGSCIDFWVKEGQSNAQKHLTIHTVSSIILMKRLICFGGRGLLGRGLGGGRFPSKLRSPTKIWYSKKRRKETSCPFSS
jgi:hypothetical protein